MPNFTAFVDGVDNVDAAAINLRFTELDTAISNIVSGVTPLSLTLVSLSQGIDLTSQASDLAAPGSGKLRVFNKSDILYLRNSAGSVFKVINAESNGQTIITATLDALTAGVTNTHLHLRRLTNTNGVGIGISFSVSADTPNAGGKFLLNRTGTNSKGRFEFWLKDNTSAGDTTVLKFIMHETGVFDFIENASPGTPASGFGRLSFNTSGQLCATDDTGNTVILSNSRTMRGFNAYDASNQTVTATTLTKLTFTTEDFDSDSWYASSRFTPLQAGYYLVGAYFWVEGNGQGYVEIQKNGAGIARSGNYSVTSTAPGSPNVAVPVYMNGSTDYLEAYGYSPSTTIFKTTRRAGFFAYQI